MNLTPSLFFRTLLPSEGLLKIPIFLEPPEGLDKTWEHGTLRGRMNSYVDKFSLAEEYKLARDLLVQSAIKNKIAYNVLAPIVYNYRDATEFFS